MDTTKSAFDNFYERLRQAREEAGLTVAGIAKALGLKKHTYYNYEAENPQKRVLPKADTLIAISKVVDRSVDWLLSGEEHITAEPKTAPMEGFTCIPRYDVECSAGGGAFDRMECVVDRLPFKTEWLKRMGVAPEHAALVTVMGDSMHPTLDSGNIMLLDLSDEKLRDGKIYALQVDGGLLIKRVQLRHNGAVTLKSDNPQYESYGLSAEEAKELRVVGRLVWAGRKF